jgi:hypothetical protein
MICAVQRNVKPVVTNLIEGASVRFKSLATLGLMLAGASTSAYAVEGGIYGAPLGGTDVRQAYLPPSPGLYGGLANVGIVGSKFTNQYGGSTNGPAYVTTDAVGAGFLYVYPYNPLGFTIASSFQLNYQPTSTQALTVNGVHKQGHGSGVADSYSDLFYASHYVGLMGATPGSNQKLKYGLTAAFGLAAEIPIGAYTATNFINTGKNTFITIPNMALTYTTGPNMALFDATEISTRFFFDTNKRNTLSGYQGGNLVDLDFSITQRLGNFQFGGAGVFAQQITSDHSATNAVVAPDGNKYMKLDVGPVLLYDSPELGTTFKFKALIPIHHENNYETTQFVISAARKLF